MKASLSLPANTNASSASRRCVTSRQYGLPMMQRDATDPMRPSVVLTRIESSPFRKDLNCMRASVSGQQELAMRVQQALALATKKEAQMVVDAVVTGLESTLLNNLVSDGFTLKLGSFGKFSVRHKPGILRKIPFTGETILTKDRRKITFVSLGNLRQHEKVVLR